MFGAAAIGHLTRLTRRADCGAYWEARFSVHVSLQTSSNPLSWHAEVNLDLGMPAQIKVLKPKFWVTGKCLLKAGNGLKFL